MKKTKIEDRWVRQPGHFFKKPSDIIEQRFDFKKKGRFQAYLQRELKQLPNGKFKTSPDYVVIKYPLGESIKEIRKWVSEADKYFKSLPAKIVTSIYDPHKARWTEKRTVRLYSEIKKPWGSNTNLVEFYRKRNSWIKQRYNQLKKEGKTNKEAFLIIKKELPLQKDKFGLWKGARRDPFKIGVSAIEKIIRYYK